MSAYETFGPYPLERDGHRLASGALRRFWKEREEDSRPGLRDAVGVYIFSVQKDEGAELVPWYVGKTDRQGFETRFGQEELRFRQVLENAKRGQLQIFILAFMSPSGTRFRKLTETKISHNEWLETMMIGSALTKNRSLLNASKVKKFKSLVVPGYLNAPPGKLPKPAQELKTMLEPKSDRSK